MPSTNDRATLAAVSAAQLACGIASAAVAVRRGHAFDLGLVRGDPTRVAAEACTIGTALSAHAPMLVTQAVATGVVLSRDSRRATSTLGWLGAAMIGGYLAERLVRQRLRPAGWEQVETPLVVTGLGLSAAMATLGLRNPRPQ